VTKRGHAKSHDFGFAGLSAHFDPARTSCWRNGPGTLGIESASQLPLCYSVNDGLVRPGDGLKSCRSHEAGSQISQ
jgi:hypothetical protein